MLSAGTEATEVALKLMRMNGQKLKQKKVGIVCFEGAYHGRTMGAQFMNGPSSDRNWIGYDDPNIHHIKFPYPWLIDNPEAFFEEEISKLIKSFIIHSVDRFWDWKVRILLGIKCSLIKKHS